MLSGVAGLGSASRVGHPKIMVPFWGTLCLWGGIVHGIPKGHNRFDNRFDRRKVVNERGPYIFEAICRCMRSIKCRLIITDTRGRGLRSSSFRLLAITVAFMFSLDVTCWMPPELQRSLQLPRGIPSGFPFWPAKLDYRAAKSCKG